ncbi:hypothetical protein RRG08_033769 [Elysia crispata]|uniref:Uncharacterized protein n=1 Tax=Elysia crispata TaxID=231223 RepID=A0AAE1ASD7_9GAST|nr:hypothetical protein RRG08_033769 [Elysia crispata]
MLCCGQGKSRPNSERHQQCSVVRASGNCWFLHIRQGVAGCAALRIIQCVQERINQSAISGQSSKGCRIDLDLTEPWPLPDPVRK